MSTSPILGAQALGFQWPTQDPFLFCVHHDDAYPPAHANLAPDPALLAGRDIGQDFAVKDGWRMYHGSTVPGFPSHPHRGFETVTIVREGLIDHSDSLGAAARFGGGDVQWLTAGRGIVHAEMFPLLRSDRGNRLELFQIWLNLPASHKMVAPHFTMLWSESIPRRIDADAQGRTAEVACIAGAGALGGIASPPSPPPASWGSQPGADLAIWTLRMQAGARWTLPAALGANTRRCLYFFRGQSLDIAGQRLPGHAAVSLRCDGPLELVNGPAETEILILQGRPIGEPVAQYGPFVMNTQAEIHQAFADYRRTEFGGWPWPSSDPVHGPELRRFARHADGREEQLAVQAETQET